MDNEACSRLSDLRLYIKERLAYSYNFNLPFHALWHREIRLEKRPPVEEKGVCPHCIGGVGAAPPEDCGGPKAFEEFRGLFTTRYILHRLADMVDERLNEGMWTNCAICGLKWNWMAVTGVQSTAG